MSIYSRTDEQLGKVIETLGELIQIPCSLNKARKLERMLVDLGGIRRSMQKLDKNDPEHRKKFWKLSRRSVLLSVNIARGISSS